MVRIVRKKSDQRSNWNNLSTSLKYRLSASAQRHRTATTRQLHAKSNLLLKERQLRHLLSEKLAECVERNEYRIELSSMEFENTAESV